jgi:hypothetical protein
MKSARFGAGLVWPLILAGASVTACSSKTPESSGFRAASLSAVKAKPAGVALGGARIMPMHFGGEAEVEAAKAKLREIKEKHSVFGPSTRLQYFGGPIVANVEVVIVDWTSAVDPIVQGILPGFYTAVTGTGSPYFSWLTEYSTTCAFGPPGCNSSEGLLGASDGLPGSNQTLGFGTYKGSGSGPGGVYIISPGNTSTSLQDSDIATELGNQITAGSLPQPTLDASGNVNTVYMIDFPNGYTEYVDSGGMLVESCVGFCGYHSTMIYDSLVVPYGVLPDESAASPCHAGCGPSKEYYDNSTSVHSHELVESITDTAVGIAGGEGVGRPLAWYDPGTAMGDMGGEAADLCDAIESQVTFDAGADGGSVTYTVQQIWSDQNDTCMAIPPICDGSSNPPSCTPCTSSSQCSSTAPDCETNSSSSFFGQCVQCSSSTTTCGELTCNASTDTCQCSSNTQCANPTPACGTASTCVGCTSDEQCKGNSAGEACASSGSCVPCTKDSDCPADMPVCNTFSNTCSTSNDAGSDASPPPVDAGHVDSGSATDSGSRDAGNSGGGPTTSGCSAAPSRAPVSETPMLLVMAGLVAFGRRRAKRRSR